MGMLSRAGQSVLRPLTPSTPPIQNPLTSPKTSPKSPAAASIDLSLLNDASVETSSAPLPLGKAELRLATPTAATNSTLVRRRSETSSTFSRRRLTVECGSRRKTIEDHIDSARDPEATAKEAIASPCRHPAQEIQTPGAVLSIWGSATTPHDKFVPYFADKRMNFDGELRNMSHRIGIVSHRGYKPESPNQDDFFVLARCDSLLMGVLDGHGPDGHDVAHFVQERLPMHITEHLRQDPDAWEGSVSSSVHDLCARAREEMGGKAETSGTTATIVMLDQPDSKEPGGPMRLRCAFLGDSIAVSARRKTKSSPWEVTQLFEIHRPDREDELERIKLSGGSVSFGCGKTPSRLQTPEWKLAMSRSFGDFHAVPYGLSNEPEVASEVQLEPDYEHLILVCSDGVWDMIDPQQAVKFVGKFSPDEAQVAVERLVSKAQRRWQETEGVVDDITAMLIWPGYFYEEVQGSSDEGEG